MLANELDNVSIVSSSSNDMPAIFLLVDYALEFFAKNGYKVWDQIDKPVLVNDMENQRHYKIVKDDELLGMFSVQFDDPFIWRDKDQGDAIYLHRIVVNPKFKGTKQFAKILDWAKNVALEKGLKCIRMDTWADNHKLINYYKSFGFVFIENYKTTDTLQLPTSNPNLKWPYYN